MVAVRWHDTWRTGGEGALISRVTIILAYCIVLQSAYKATVIRVRGCPFIKSAEEVGGWFSYDGF